VEQQHASSSSEEIGSKQEEGDLLVLGVAHDASPGRLVVVVGGDREQVQR
jgi:hypothetical protein